MSGLIWGGIGKGIADAGQSIGGMMLKGIEADRQDEREALREQRLLDRQAALDQLKADREEAKLKRDAEIYSQAEANAPAIGDKRRFEKFKADVGQTDMSDEDLRKVFDEQYNQRRVGNFEGADRYRERYSKEKEDTLNEIRRLGGSSAAIKEGRESYKAAVEAETRADKEAMDRRREDRKDLQAQQTAEYQTGMVAAAMQRADAATIAANRPPSERGSAQDRLTTMINSANQTIKSLNEGSKGKTPEEKANWQRQMDDAVALRDMAQRQLKENLGAKSDDKPKGGDNSNVKPSASSFKVGETRTVASGPNKGKTAEWDGRGWVLK